ncbi:hypothetical protein C8J56DRAFT_1139167 [Mycena floridula]|nr:hypothetical protein C8J56DRAFT_1139167 [Mycena floridula]
MGTGRPGHSVGSSDLFPSMSRLSSSSLLRRARKVSVVVSAVFLWSSPPSSSNVSLRSAPPILASHRIISRLSSARIPSEMVLPEPNIQSSQIYDLLDIYDKPTRRIQDATNKPIYSSWDDPGLRSVPCVFDVHCLDIIWFRQYSFGHSKLGPKSQQAARTNISSTSSPPNPECPERRTDSSAPTRMLPTAWSRLEAQDEAFIPEAGNLEETRSSTSSNLPGFTHGCARHWGSAVVVKKVLEIREPMRSQMELVMVMRRGRWLGDVRLSAFSGRRAFVCRLEWPGISPRTSLNKIIGQSLECEPLSDAIAFSVLLPLLSRLAIARRSPNAQLPHIPRFLAQTEMMESSFAGSEVKVEVQASSSPQALNKRGLLQYRVLKSSEKSGDYA